MECALQSVYRNEVEQDPLKLAWTVRRSRLSPHTEFSLPTTVIFSLGKRLSGNSFETLEFAIKHRKPYLHLSAVFKDNAAQKLKKWVQQNNIHVLNVAGPRGSKEPTVAGFVITTFDAALKP